MFYMSDRFSKFFVMDADSTADEETPKFTACIAILLFREMMRSYLLESKDDVAIKCCWIHNEFNVPIGYPNKDPVVSLGHCLTPIYMYTGYYPPKTMPYKIDGIKKLCKEADCSDRSHPEKVHNKIVEEAKRYICKYPLNDIQYSIKGRGWM